MVKKKTENEEKFKTHVNEIQKLFNSTNFYKLLNEKELLKRLGFIMLIQRDILVKYFTREEDVQRDFHQQDEYFDANSFEKSASKKKNSSAKKTSNKKKLDTSEVIVDTDSEKMPSDDESIGSSRRGRRRGRNKNFDVSDLSDYNEEDEDRDDEDLDDDESDDDSILMEQQQIEEQTFGTIKPFLIFFFETYARSKFKRLNGIKLEEGIKRHLCYFASMVEMHSDILGVLFRTTRHIRFKSEFGERVIFELEDSHLSPEELFMNQQLINILVHKLFENLGEAIKAISLNKMQKFFTLIMDLYKLMKPNKIFRSYMKMQNSWDKFKNFKEKLNLLITLSSFINKNYKFFSKKQLQVLYSMVWEADDLGIIFFQNVAQLRTSNEVMIKIDEKEKEWDELKVSKNLLDLFMDEEGGGGGGANLKNLVEDYMSQGQVKNKSDEAIENELRKQRKQIRKSSRQYSSIAERFILLAVLTQTDQDPNFQEMLQFFFCGFVNTILEKKLFLTHQSNFSREERDEISEDDIKGESQIINLFRMFLGLSRNMLRMINYIIEEVKENKSQYRQMLGYLHSLKNHKFITVMIDKLTKTEIERLKEDEGVNPVLKYIQKDQIKKSEVTIIKDFDQLLVEGKKYFCN